MKSKQWNLVKMPPRNNWTREELILAFNLYCQIPFGSIHTHNPRIKYLARLLGRSESAVSLKLANFSRLDPALNKRGIHGLSHGSKGEVEVWLQFSANAEALAWESERLLATRLGKKIEDVTEIETDDLPKVGIERDAMVRLRVNQNFFRKRILSAYNYRCCITGLNVQPLLVASHILPWADDVPNRLNPRNGLCLNALHDRAFDRHLMWIEEGFVVRFASKLISANSGMNWLLSFEGKALELPKYFAPDFAFLKRHADRCRSHQDKIEVSM